MAKILFSARSNIIWAGDNVFDPYYEGFLTELKNNAHDILVIRTNDIVHINNQCHHAAINNIIIEKIKNFKPDLIITANNSMPDCVYKNTNCPIMLLMVDSPTFFEGPSNIKQNIDRYLFLHVGWESVFHKDCINLFGAKPEQNYEIGYQSAIQAYEIEKKYNISFVGTVGWGRNIENSFLKINSNAEFEEFLKQFNHKDDTCYENTDVIYALTSNMRIKTLDALCDLGLNIFGWKENIVIAFPYSLDLIKCFNFDPVITLQASEKMLNESIISITLPNAQAIRSLSWRVADILASNSCLISPPKEDLKLISPYVDIPTFTSPLEARELCKKLLKDEEWRKEIIVGSQKSINENHRFSHMIEKLNNLVNLTIHNPNATKQNINYETISHGSMPARYLLPKTKIDKIKYYFFNPKAFANKIQEKYF